MKLHRTLGAALLWGILLSGCNEAGTDVGSSSQRETFRVGAMEFSIPIGSDGHVKSGENGADWGFDSQMWARTVAVVGATGAGGPSPVAIVGRSSVPNKMVSNTINKVGLNKVASGDGEAYQSRDPIYKYPPVYFFKQDLPGYVECPTATTQGQGPDMERCIIHVAKDGVHHSFFLTREQVPLAAETARIFLATITAK